MVGWTANWPRRLANSWFGMWMARKTLRMSQALSSSRPLRVGDRMMSPMGRTASASPRRVPRRRRVRKERKGKVARRQRKRHHRVLLPLPSPKTVRSRRLFLQARLVLRPVELFFLGGLANQPTGRFIPGEWYQTTLLKVACRPLQ